MIRPTDPSVACAGGPRSLPEAALSAGPLRIRDYGPRGVWVEGDAALVEPLAAAWAAAIGSAVRLYRVRAGVDGELLQLEVRAWTIDADGGRVPRSGVADDEEGPGDGESSLHDVVAERLAIALEMWEQLHHDDAAVRVWPAER